MLKIKLNHHPEPCPVHNRRPPPGLVHAEELEVGHLDVVLLPDVDVVLGQLLQEVLARVLLVESTASLNNM